MPHVEAHITRVVREEGSEFADIFTDDDTVKKLGTKRPDLIAEAVGFKQSGELVAIQYNDRPRSVQTEHGPRTFHNYYYEGAGPIGNGAGSRPAAQQQIPGLETATAMGREDPPGKRWSIALSVGAKLAVDTLPLMPIDQRDFETQWRICIAWAERIYFTERPERPGVVRSPLGSYNEDPGRPREDAPPPYTDDDIPFG
jgi:hypothetical protein